MKFSGLFAEKGKKLFDGNIWRPLLQERPNKNEKLLRRSAHESKRDGHYSRRVKFVFLFNATLEHLFTQVPIHTTWEHKKKRVCPPFQKSRVERCFQPPQWLCSSFIVVLIAIRSGPRSTEKAIRVEENKKHISASDASGRVRVVKCISLTVGWIFLLPLVPHEDISSSLHVDALYFLKQGILPCASLSLFLPSRRCALALRVR